MRRRFAKYEGLGNDFVLVDAGVGEISREVAVGLCDRRRGVGADGVIVVSPHRELDAQMVVINADGSVPEMCGNGIRCVALHLALARDLERGELVIATDAGPRTCQVERSRDSASVRVDMGVVRYLGDRELDVAGEHLALSLADAGNPHAIVFGEIDEARLDRIGSLVSTHAMFPKGTNVELASVHGDAIDLIVWERGVGRTLACGTGACATVVAAAAKGLLRAPRVRVTLPGGDLEIEATDRATFMTGPARFVFTGETRS